MDVQIMRNLIYMIGMIISHDLMIELVNFVLYKKLLTSVSVKV